MKSRKYKSGFTLVELLIVITIIAILSSLVITAATRMQSKACEQLAENTIAILTAALGQFRDAGYNYKDQDYEEFDFPVDCNNYPLEDTLKNALGATSVLIGPVGPAINHDNDEYSGCEAMYFFLSRVPECREILDKIDSSLITNKDANGNAMKITIDGKDYPLLRLIDPWGKTLRYNYYEDETVPDDRRTFPLVASAGPDGQFGTSDDISNKK